MQKTIKGTTPHKKVEFVPVYEWMKINGLGYKKKQNVYRWIREGKFIKDEELVQSERITKRYMIRKDAKPHFQRNMF